LRSSDQYLLATNTTVEQDDSVQITAAPGGYHSPLINGRVYAFDRRTGVAQWPVPAVIEQYGLPLQQSTELPVLAFLRQIVRRTRGRSTAPTTSVLCIDRRDGRILFPKDDIPIQIQGRAFQMLGDPVKKTVMLLLPGKTYTIQLTDAPRPPEPPAQTGSASSRVAEGPGHGTRKVAGGIVQALGNALLPKADPKRVQAVKLPPPQAVKPPPEK